MKNHKKIVIGILDQGVWFDNYEGELKDAFDEYYGKFEMENLDFADQGTRHENVPAGDHGFYVLDRLLQVCGNYDIIKVINGKVFSSWRSDPMALIRGLKYMADNEVDLLNLSLGIPKAIRVNRRYLTDINCELDRIVNKGGLTLISAGNEGEVFRNGFCFDNANWLAEDPDNNLSVGSHDRNGRWDKFSSSGGSVDVSAIGSDLCLMGRNSLATVSGTSFSCPSMTGFCANVLIDQLTKLKTGEKTVKELVFEHMSEAIKPKYKMKFLGNKNPWFGYGSFESYIKYFLRYYKRDVLQHALFYDTNIRNM